jgi:hypothetical protein
MNFLKNNLWTFKKEFKNRIKIINRIKRKFSHTKIGKIKTAWHQIWQVVVVLVVGVVVVVVVVLVVNVMVVVVVVVVVMVVVVVVEREST